MSNTKWVVRIVTQNIGAFDKACQDSPIIECFRHAGHVQVHRSDETGKCFDILPPNGIRNETSQAWAQRNAERMASLGVNAVAAPEWDPKSSGKKPGYT